MYCGQNKYSLSLAAFIFAQIILNQIFMLKTIVAFALFLSTFFSYALRDSIGIKEVNGKKYIMHKVEKGQGLFAVSKRYGVSVDDVKLVNNNVETLALDQVILVPIPKVNIEEKKFTHKVEKGETLYKIAKLYNVSVENLKKWNNLSDESIREGMEIQIVQLVKYVDVEPQPNQVKKDNTKTQDAKSVTEEGIATWIEDPNIDSRKALALHKKAPVGTIIMVTNLMNDKQIYVKVVGNLPKNEHSNEIIKLSKFAAKQLKLRDQLTRVRLSYELE